MISTAIRRAFAMAALAVTLGACSDRQDVMEPVVELDAPGFARREVLPQIAFGSDEAPEMYRMNEDGSGYQLLKKATGVNPAWSPDRSRIVYANTSPADPGLDVLSVGSGRVVRLLDGDVRHPRFSPDGSRIAFAYAPMPYERYIYVINADGTGLRQVTASGTQLWDWSPSWSPDGERIAFLGNRSDGMAAPANNLWTVNADGTGLARITDCAAANVICHGGSWSPVDERIAFSFRSTSSMDRGVAIVGASGGSWQTLVVQAGHGFELQPAWSPDGSRLAFRSAMSGNAELYVMDADGSNVERLTYTPMREGYPAWAR